MRPILLLIISCWLSACRSKELILISFPEGGFKYAEQEEIYAPLFFRYPLKDSLLVRDSVRAAFYDPLFFGSFNELNLSLRPPVENTFRFTIECGLLGYAAVLILTQDRIVVKEVKTGYPYGYQNDSLLDMIERDHLGFLQFYFPLHEYRDNDKGKGYIDSVTKIYPQLRDPVYFAYLLKKSSNSMEERFTYRKWVMQISQEKYLYFIGKLNASEYWKVGPNPKCTVLDTDQSRYFLEAATLDQYHAVDFTDCDELASLNDLCHELMTYSGMRESEEKWRNKRFSK